MLIPNVILALAGLGCVVPVLMTLRDALRGTTLTAAWNWLAAVWCLWIGTCVAALWSRDGDSGLIDQLWYAVGVLLLCPPMVVLGAKRPMTRAWGWFIMLPLVLVFAWPAASAWGLRWHDVPWALEEPVLAGYAFVLFMGVGNYLGTRSAIPALLYAIAALLVTAPLCPTVAARLPDAPVCSTVAALCIASAAWIGFWQARRSRTAAFPLDRVWRDFRDVFGIVWSRRIQERFNSLARQSNWDVRLTAEGFTATNNSPEMVVATEGALRWLLRRFVDPAWIDRRFG